MTKTSKLTGLPGAATQTPSAATLKRFAWLLVAAAFLTFLSPRAQGQDDEYLRILDLVDQADAMNTNGPPGPVVAKFQEAQTALRTFQRAYPDWNVKVVSYRLNYIAAKLAAFSHDTSSSAASGNVTDSSTPASRSTPTTSTPQLKLLEPGAEPRKELRLHPKPEDKQTIMLTMKMGMGTKLGEMETPAVKLPMMKMTLDLTVKTVAANGDIAYEMVITDASVVDEPGVTPQVAEAMKATWSGAKGLSGIATMSSRGFNQGIDLKAPASADPQTRQAMDQMKESLSTLSIPLPEEAVGPGAKWTAKTPLKSQGMTIDQTATYQLVSIEGERLNAKTAIAQSAANQKMQNPSMPGVKLDLAKMVGEGTGEVTFDLTQLLPREGTFDSHSDLSMSMNMGGQKQAMTMKIDLNLRLEAK